MRVYDKIKSLTDECWKKHNAVCNQMAVLKEVETEIDMLNCEDVDETEVTSLRESDVNHDGGSVQQGGVNEDGMIFEIDERPPFHIAFMYALQVSTTSGSVFGNSSSHA